MPITVYCDQMSVQNLLTAKHLSGRMARWALKLQEFQPTIEFIQGIHNHCADALSRAPVTCKTNFTTLDVPTGISSDSDLENYQKTDPFLSNV